MFTVRFPFRLPEGRDFQLDDGEVLVDENISILKGPYKRWFVLEVSGFESEEKAELYLQNIRLGFYWFLLRKGISVKADYTLSKVVEIHPESIFGKEKDIGADGQRPAIYRSELKIATVWSGDVSAYVSSSGQELIDVFKEGMGFAKSTELEKFPKLSLALGLYGSYYHESSDGAKFLTLMTILEVLSEDLERPDFVMNVLSRWEQEINTMLEVDDLEDDVQQSFSSIRDGVLFQKQESITRKIRALVSAVFSEEGKKISNEKEKKAAQLYSLRSRLTHDGKIKSEDLEEAIKDAKEIVVHVLETKLKQTVS